MAATRSRWWKVIGGLAVALLLLFYFLPSILGSRWVIDPVLARLKDDQFHLKVDSARLRWLAPISIYGITIQDASGSIAAKTPFLKIREIRSDRGLLGYLWYGKDLGRLEIHDAIVDIELLKDGNNISKLVSSLQNQKTKSKEKPKLDFEIGVRNLSVTVNREGEPEPLVVVPPFSADVAYRAIHGPAHLEVKPAKILDKVELTNELTELGLTYGIPTLAKSAWFEGRISLATDQLIVPLEDPKGSEGSASITLHEVKSGPSDPNIIQLLAMIAKLRNKPPIDEFVFVDGTEIKVRAAQRRIHHEGLEIGLPKIDPRLQISSKGSVGMDDRSLDLLISIPVPIEMLARRESVKELGVPTIDLPIRGTLDDPKLHWEELRKDSANLLALISSQLGSEAPGTAAAIKVLEGIAEGNADDAIGNAVDLIQELRDRRKARKEAEAAGDPPEKSQPIRDTLRDIFRRGK